MCVRLSVCVSLSVCVCVCVCVHDVHGSTTFQLMSTHTIYKQSTLPMPSKDTDSGVILSLITMYNFLLGIEKGYC